MINDLNIIEKSCAPSGQEQTPIQRSKGKWRQCAMLAVVGLAAALLTGCAPGKYTGGGFIQSAAGGNQKATFGFELEGIDATGAGQVTLEFGEVGPTTFDVWALAKGHFTYNDHGAGVQFQFDCDEETSIPADGSFPSGVWVVTTDDPFNPQARGAVFYGP